MSKIWIVVADSCHARIFAANTPSAVIEELDDLVHPEGSQHAIDLSTDLPGKQHDSNSLGHHKVVSQSEPHQREVNSFAQDLTHYLRKKLLDNKYSRLIIISEPSFLGVLRNAFDTQLKSAITMELDKNLVKHSVEDIRSHLPRILPI